MTIASLHSSLCKMELGVTHCGIKETSMKSLVPGLLAALVFWPVHATDAAEGWKSHPPTRPVPVAFRSELAKGPKKYVDPAKGDDANDGTEARPWKTVA